MGICNMTLCSQPVIHCNHLMLLGELFNRLWWFSSDKLHGTEGGGLHFEEGCSVHE